MTTSEQTVVNRAFKCHPYTSGNLSLWPPHNPSFQICHHPHSATLFSLSRHHRLQIPESSGSCVAVDEDFTHLFQLLHNVAASSMTGLPGGHILAASAWRSRICKARPFEACLAMWQCRSHDPGLSALKAMMIKPLAGINTTSRRGGLNRFRRMLAGVYMVFSACWRMAKSCPWRWIWGVC